MTNSKVIYTKARIATLGIDTDNRGLALAWNFIREKICASKLASIVFKDKHILNLQGCGGFFTEHKFVNVLVLPLEYVDPERNVITFHDYDEAATLIHECCHFIHVVSNGGRYTQKDIPDIDKLGKITFTGRIDQKLRYFVEREAWNLSLNLEKVFHMGIKTAIDRINSENMLIVSRNAGIHHMTIEECRNQIGTHGIEEFKYDKL